MDPIVLPSNQPPDRFYRGGARIADFRGVPSEGPRTPEDWIASTTTCNDHSSLGLTRLPNGKLLRDEIESAPQQWLGKEHIEKFGVDTKLLVKLLDAGQRLPIHAHPHVNWARKHVGTTHGKAEAWYILTPGVVYLGLKRDIDQAELLQMVEKQDIDTLLGLMHRVPVQPHQTVYIPAGLLHAIGEGILLAEVQEPEDLSVLLEWRDFEIDGVKDGHLGLGFETALTAVENRARTDEEISGLVSQSDAIGSVLVQDAGEYFVLERRKIEGKEESARGFAIMIILEGKIEVVSEHGKPFSVRQGETAVIPWAAGKLKLEGSGQVLIARPPAL